MSEQNSRWDKVMIMTEVTKGLEVLASSHLAAHHCWFESHWGNMWESQVLFLIDLSPFITLLDCE